jgi:hypothetical protein
MKKLTLIPNQNRRYRWHGFIFLPIVLFMLFSSCAEKKQPYTILRFYGNAGVMNYSRLLYLISYYADSTHPGAMIVKKGDLLAYNEIMSQFTDPAQDSIAIKTVSDKCYLNGKLNSVNIGKKDTIENVLKDILSQDISALSMIIFESAIPESTLPLLEKIARVKPEISLGFTDHQNNLDAILKMFKPKIILLPNTSESELKVTAQLSRPEMMLIGTDDSVIKREVPSIPSLKQLIIYMEDQPVPPDFLSANPQIEQLTVFASKYFDFNELKPLKELVELNIGEADSISNQEILKNNTTLEVLAVLSKEFKYDSTLDNLKNLRWVTFPQEIGQNEFDRFVEKHPGLEVVEITEGKNLKISKSMLTLNKLQGLTLFDHPIDSSEISQLKNLKYLSLPKDDLKDNNTFAAIRKSMPNTIIAGNGGICLGSGWLLLLIPVVLIIRLVIIRTTRTHQYRG